MKLSLCVCAVCAGLALSSQTTAETPALFAIQNGIGTNDAGAPATTDALVLIDTITGEGFIVGPTVSSDGTAFAAITCLAYDSTAGVLRGISVLPAPVSLVAIDPATALVTDSTPISAIGVPGLGGSVLLESLAYDADEQMLVAYENTTDQLVTINPSSGQLTSVTGVPASARPAGVSNVIAGGLGLDANNGVVFTNLLGDMLFRTTLSVSPTPPTPLAAAFDTLPFITGVSLTGLAIEPDTGSIFGVDTTGVNVLFSFDEPDTLQVIRTEQDSGAGSDLDIVGLTFAPLPGCGAADLVPPFGVVDGEDLERFGSLFVDERAEADVDGSATVDFFDFAGYLDAFAEGCESE